MSLALGTVEFKSIVETVATAIDAAGVAVIVAAAS